ncbi:ABC transporter ATP-binding protein [Periweissella beninensis]|nr:ABC transporter ATP-binding protein [Periweissella beninensis]
MVNTILKEADLFCPNSVRINFTIYLTFKKVLNYIKGFFSIACEEV